MTRFTRTDSPLGVLTLASDGIHLTGLWLEGQKHFPTIEGWVESPQIPVFAQTQQWLRDYFSGCCPDPQSIPLAPEGTPFQKRVWRCLLEIPYGATTTYGTLSRKLNRGSAHAVGNAVGRNPISILIPCHRVLGSNGQLTGYAGGLERKKWLLDLESSI